MTRSEARMQLLSLPDQHLTSGTFPKVTRKYSIDSALETLSADYGDFEQLVPHHEYLVQCIVDDVRMDGGKLLRLSRG